MGRRRTASPASRLSGHCHFPKIRTLTVVVVFKLKYSLQAVKSPISGVLFDEF